MAIMQVESSNPNFSFVISKNPNSGMQIKSIRKGKAFGWYKHPQVFNVYFKDAENEISYTRFKDETFEYLNVTRYNSPLFPLAAMNEFFSSAIKKQHTRDEEGYLQRCMINLTHVEHERYLEFFKVHFPSFELSYEEVVHKNYRIEIKTNRTLHELFHYVSVLYLFLAFISNEYIDISENIIEKYLKSINAIDAPFFIRYLFARNMLTRRAFFEKYKKDLESTKQYAIQFAYGHTGIQRREWISKQLTFDKSILDVGCGEGAYAIPFSKKIKDYSYYAVDIDPIARQKVENKVKDKKIDNVILYESLDHVLEMYDAEEEVEVLLTEVAEHMPVEEAKQLIQQILTQVNFSKLIITTPNAAFNEYYALDHFRHPDHHWEMNTSEFEMWVQSFDPENEWDITFFGIGDKVNGISTTQAAVIKKKGASER